VSAALVAGVDIGTTRTCAVVAEVAEDARGHTVAKILGVGQARTQGVKQVVSNIEETTESVRGAMREASLMAGTEVDRVYVGVDGEHVEAMTSLGVVPVRRGEITPADVDAVHEVARAVALGPDRELLHAVPQEYRVDHQHDVKDPVGMAAVRLEADVYLITGSSVVGDNIRKAVQRAGFGVEELVFEPLAAARAVLTEDEKEVGVAMVDMGGGTTDVAVYYGGELRQVAVLPVGGLTITNDLVRGLSIPFAEARRAKETYGVAFAQLVDPTEAVELPGPSPGQTRQVARELIAHVVEQRLDEIFGMVHELLECNGHLPHLGAGIVLTGGASSMHGTRELAQHVFAAPVRYGLPGEGLAGLADSVGRPRFATAVGLVLHGMDRYARTGRGASTFTSGLVSRVGSWIKEFF